MEEAKTWAAGEHFTLHGIVWHVPLELGRNCMACVKHCQVSVQVKDRQPTDLMRFEFSDYRPEVSMRRN